MSHIVSIKTEVRDPQAVASACRRLGLPEPVTGTAKLYSGEATGLIVKLPGWLYPVVVDPATGQVKFDNFEGRWGDQRELDQLLQIYAVEKARLEARKKGYSVSEQALGDGSIKLQIVEGPDRVGSRTPSRDPGVLRRFLASSAAKLDQLFNHDHR